MHKRLPDEYAEAAKEFGRLVRRRRESRNWSIDEMIRRTDHRLNPKTLARVERGLSDDGSGTPNNTELRVLLEIARVLEGRVIIDFAHPHAFTIEFDDEK